MIGIRARLMPWPPAPGVPRLTAFALPAGRYLHGLGPHPADSGGQPRLPTDDPALLSLFGADLYNHGCWWEAHEAWEAAWMPLGAQDPYRCALQGLIQAANAHLKLELDQRRAVERLKPIALKHLREGGEAALHGLDLGSWAPAFETYICDRLAEPRLAHDRARYPYLPGSR